ncbi:Lhr family ATP-dependent helicase [Nonomuraea dietziae]|uniref:Lhr family ATP-dependent helicase n=1 Tax=Nonomuraea dietziae TaxID=65515 RepID=UPI003379C50F
MGPRSRTPPDCADALGAPLPVGIPHAFLEPVADPLGDLVARHARTRGPFHASTAAARFGLGVAVITDALRRLAASGRVVNGEFRPGGRGEEWCDAGVLRLLRRRSLARLRKEVEPVPHETLALFAPTWHGITGRGGQAPRSMPGGAISSARSMDALVNAIEQMQGAAVPASSLETLVLPSRVPGYHPALLDELTSSGEVIWAGQGSLPGGDGWVSLFFADTAPLLLSHPCRDHDDAAARAGARRARRRWRAVLPRPVRPGRLDGRPDADHRPLGPRVVRQGLG